MSEQPSPPPAESDIEPSPDPLPRWVPIAIGAILVTMATLAVITGLRYRDQTLVQMVRRRPVERRATAPAPPGEPEAGASLVFPGDGANVPVPAEDESQVGAVVRMSARRGMQITATPADAVVYVNGIAIGQASHFDTEDETYDFAEPGSYTVKLVAPGHKDRQYVVIVSDDARMPIARIETRLEKE